MTSAGWWLTYPSEKSWSSSVGMIFPFPISGKSNKIPWFQSPPTRVANQHQVIVVAASPFHIFHRALVRKAIPKLRQIVSESQRHGGKQCIKP